MGDRKRMVVWALLGLLLAALGRLGWAEARAPVVSDLQLTPVWGSIYRLTALIQSERGLITATEYRVGHDRGLLYAADGMLDSRDELVETYIDAGSAGAEIFVRAQAGGTWSAWIPAELADGAGPGRTGCTLESPMPGSGEWHRGPVTVDCAALVAAEGAESLEYSLDFYDWIPAGTRFVVGDEGVHWVQVRTVTADGLAGLPSTFTVAVDWTAPRIWMQPPPAESMTHADVLLLDFSAEDDISGVALVVGDLNGEQEIMAGMPVELWQLPLGWHTLSAYTRDHAGNAAWTEGQVDLEVTVDAGALSRLVHRFAASGKLDGYTGLKGALLVHLSRAQGAEAEGRMWEARIHLSDFVDRVQQSVAEGLIFPDAGAVLAEDATWLMEGLDDDDWQTPPDWGGQ